MILNVNIKVKKIKKTTHYAFGKRICNLLSENNKEEIILNYCKEKGDYSIFKFIKGETSSEELLNAFSGWSDYATITKELYEKIVDI